MNLLGDVRLKRVHAERRGRDARKGQEGAAGHCLRHPDERLGKGDVDSEGGPIELACQARLRAIAPTIIDKPGGLDLG